MHKDFYSTMKVKVAVFMCHKPLYYCLCALWYVTSVFWLLQNVLNGIAFASKTLDTWQGATHMRLTIHLYYETLSNSDHFSPVESSTFEACKICSHHVHQSSTAWRWWHKLPFVKYVELHQFYDSWTVEVKKLHCAVLEICCFLWSHGGTCNFFSFDLGFVASVSYYYVILLC